MIKREKSRCGSPEYDDLVYEGWVRKGLVELVSEFNLEREGIKWEQDMPVVKGIDV